MTSVDDDAFKVRVLSAVNRLEAKRDHLMAKAGRAPRGSNGRKVALDLAKQLRAFSMALTQDHDLAVELAADGMLEAGWQRLGKEIVAIYTRRARQASNAAAAQKEPASA